MDRPFASTLAAAGGAILLFGGCASSHRAGVGAGASVDQRATVALRAFASCVRAHGLPDFPDPQIGSDGVPRFPDSAPRVPATAQQACRRIAAEIPAQYSSTTAVSSSDYAKLLRLARCIRAHGIRNWPDPNALGEFPIDATNGQGGKRVLPAVRACARLNPDPNGGIHVVRAHPAP